MSPWRLESTVSCHYVPNFLRFQVKSSWVSAKMYPTFRHLGSRVTLLSKKKRVWSNEMGGPSFYLPSPVPKSRLSISMHANCMDGYKTIRKWTPPPLANWIVEKIALPIFHKLHRFVVHGFFYFQRRLRQKSIVHAFRYAAPLKNSRSSILIYISKNNNMV